MQVNMTVNGESVAADVEPRTLLVHFLRINCGSPEPTGAATPATAEPAWWTWTANR